MIIDELKKALLLKGLTFKQKVVVWWFSLSLCLLCVTADAPFWVHLVEVINLGISAHYLKRIPLPEYFEEE